MTISVVSATARSMPAHNCCPWLVDELGGVGEGVNVQTQWAADAASTAVHHTETDKIGPPNHETASVEWHWGAGR